MKPTSPRGVTSASALGRSVLLGVLFLLAGIALLAGRAPRPALSDDSSAAAHAAILPVKAPPGKEIATFAGGCFWARDAIFRQLKGVDKVEAGYAGGHTTHPTYEEVCTGDTGHAETVQIVFDPKVVSYHELLEVFFHTHDPTTLNAQLPDTGTQYRSAVFYHDAAQKEAARQVIHELEAAHAFSDPIVTQVYPYTGFYRAEEYHQNYFALNPDQGYCRDVVAPEVAHFRAQFRSELK